MAWVAAGALLLAWTHRPAPRAAAPAPLPQPGQQRLKGAVRTTAGAPVAGAAVIVLNRDGRELLRARTDELGRYTLNGVQTGLHHLVVTAAHH